MRKCEEYWAVAAIFKPNYEILHERKSYHGHNWCCDFVNAAHLQPRRYVLVVQTCSLWCRLEKDTWHTALAALASSQRPLLRWTTFHRQQKPLALTACAWVYSRPARTSGRRRAGRCRTGAAPATYGQTGRSAPSSAWCTWPRKQTHTIQITITHAYQLNVAMCTELRCAFNGINLQHEQNNSHFANSYSHNDEESAHVLVHVVHQVDNANAHAVELWKVQLIGEWLDAECIYYVELTSCMRLKFNNFNSGRGCLVLQFECAPFEWNE